jgi:putative tryptophan/tyrosine transport system substrate-binding protein
MLINTDSSIDKYSIAQKEFQQTIGQPISVVRLDDEKWQNSSPESLFLGKRPALIYCIGTKAYMLANQYAGETDIVFSSIINWLRLPLTPKTYGVSNELHIGMQLMLFRHIFPNIRKIGILYSKEFNGEWFAKAVDEAKKMGIVITEEVVSESKNAVSSLKKLLSDNDAFWLISDPVIMPDKAAIQDILKICDAVKKPVFSYNEFFAGYGAILIVSPDNQTIGRQAAGIAAEILRKGRISDNVQYPAGTHIILNLKKTKAYGLKYNEESLGSINEIIE